MDIAHWISQLRKGAAEFAVLSALNRCDRYGLDILEATNRGGEIVTEGALYPLLNRLEKDGKLSSYWVTDNAPHPRKYYRITKNGARLASSMHDAWIEFRKAMIAAVEDEP